MAKPPEPESAVEVKTTPQPIDNPEATPETAPEPPPTGITTVEDQVIARVAGLAIRDIPGVWSLGSTSGKALEMMRQAVGVSGNPIKGINVQVEQRKALISLELVVSYPHPLKQVANAVREAIIGAVEGIVGLDVAEVNIDIVDVHLPPEGENPKLESGPVEKEG